MSEENEKVVKKAKIKKKKFAYSAGKITVRVIAALMAISMVFAVAATCIFYIKYYI